jgi:outer membrane protein OmpA-like peptidoglycan-associated protein
MVMTPLSVRCIAVVAALLVSAVAIAPTWAQDLSAADIIAALKPKPKVRALTLDQSKRESRQSELVNRLQSEKTRSLTVDEQDEIAAVVENDDLPAIDLDLFFATDSAEIASEALPILEKLGAALNDEQLEGSVFLVAGYADADEADGMAEERAQAVRSFLIGKFSIAPERLVAAGLDAQEAPLEGGKRRVRVVNMASQPAAKAGE